MQKKFSSSVVRNHRRISITPVFEKIVARKLSHFLQSNCLLLPSQFSYRRVLGTCDTLVSSSYHQQVALDRGKEGRLVQLDFSAPFDSFGHRCLLYKLTTIGVLVHSVIVS